MTRSLLEALDEPTRRAVLGGAATRRFRRDEVVFHAGDPAASLHVLVSGHVSITVTTPGGDRVVLTVLGPGATFGELALLRQEPVRSATATALDAVETLTVRADELARLRREQPGVDRALVELLSGYLRRQDARLLEALYVPVEKRVLRRLLALAELYGGGAPGTVVPLTQDVLAGMAGSTRPTTNQVLRAAEAAGLIAVERRRLQVLDPQGLARRAR